MRGAALVLVALVAYALRWAGAMFTPVPLGPMASHALSPAVDDLQRWRIPRARGAAVLLVVAVCGLGSTPSTLSDDDAAALVESLRDAAQRVRDSLRITRGTSGSPIQKVQRAAEKLEATAEESGPAAPFAAGC